MRIIFYTTALWSTIGWKLSDGDAREITRADIVSHEKRGSSVRPILLLINDTVIFQMYLSHDCTIVHTRIIYQVYSSGH